ncbi:MAG: hypothetical protein ACRCUS_00285 [Anaerovoracaceae bacterium]
MGKKEKLIAKLISRPKDMTVEELSTAIGYLDYSETATGKTSGSCIKFRNSKTNMKIILHRPHPDKHIKTYQIKQIVELLREREDIK